jgi:hypothetical protein
VTDGQGTSPEGVSVGGVKGNRGLRSPLLAGSSNDLLSGDLSWEMQKEGEHLKKEKLPQ